MSSGAPTWYTLAWPRQRALMLKVSETNVDPMEEGGDSPSD